jgi:hypothetical protein
VELLASEEVVVLEVEVINPEALLDVAVALEERGLVELELEPLLLLLLAVEACVVLELLVVLGPLLGERGVAELELLLLLLLKEEAELEEASVDVELPLVTVEVLAEREVAELELLVEEEDDVLEDGWVGVEEVCGAEEVLDDVVDDALEAELSGLLLELLREVFSVEVDEELVSEETVA